MQRNIYIPVYVLVLLISIFAVGGAGKAAEESRSATFFSQGQAAYNPQDHAKGQQQAIQDFMAQALTQAISSFLSPAQMGSRFSEIQKKVLAKPSKYIDSYQVFSETQTGDGMFRVIGQVTVSIDALKKDLEQSGILAAQQKTNPAPAPSEAMSASASPAEGQGPGEEKAQGSSQEVETSQAETSPAQPAEAGRNPSASRGISATRSEILWVVSEKWEQGWELPTEGTGDEFLFARSMNKEMEEHNLSINLPMSGSVRMDLSGSVPSSQAISLAEGLGFQDAVVGKISFTQDRSGKQVYLDASLRVIRIGQGKSEFELHKAQSMEDLTNQEGALELARLVAAELVSLLGGPKAARAPGVTPDQTGNAGPLTITLPSNQFTFWNELEGILRKQWKNIQIKGLEIGPAETVVRLDGVSGDFILKLSGTPLPSGAALRVDSYSTEAHTMKISFAPPGKVQTEKQ